MKHREFKSIDGSKSMILCLQGSHVKNRHCPDYRIGAPTTKHCELCIKDGIKFCEFCNVGAIANNMILRFARIAQAACPLCSEAAPLPARVIDLPVKKNASRAKYQKQLEVQKREEEECSGQ